MRGFLVKYASYLSMAAVHRRERFPGRKPGEYSAPSHGNLLNAHVTTRESRYPADI
jgi:hypothetical protein